MRKNNFLKIFVSLVMCLMLVLSLVACGGTDGIDGVNGKDGVGIAGVTYEDGKLTINYTNNKTDSFDLVAESAACEHNYSNPVELVKHAIDANGTYIKVCGECGAAAVVEDIIHNTVATEVAATCIEYGYTADVCACGYETNKVMGTEYAEHQMTTKGYVALAGKSICEDGGTLLQYCTYCKLTAQTETEAIGHKVEEWKIVTKPTVDTMGKIEGQCVQCDKVDPIEDTLPELSAENGYEVEVVTAKKYCTDNAGKALYTITYKGYTFEKIEGGIKTNNHVLAGKPMDELVWAVPGNNGTVAYAYDATLEGIKLVADTKLVCETVIKNAGFFTCEACKEPVLVDVFRCHNGKLAEGATVPAAICGVPQKKNIVKCDYEDCGKTEAATVPGTPHKYAVSYVMNETVEIDGKYQVTSLSKVCDLCGGEDTTFAYEKDSAFIKIISESTCSTHGKAQLTYKKAANTSAVTEEVALSLGAHKLGDELVAKGAKVDSRLVKLFAGESEKLNVCLAEAKGFFECGVCSETVDVVAYLEHDVELWKTETEATCKDKGVLTGVCNAEKCTEANKLVTKYTDKSEEHTFITVRENEVDGVCDLRRFCKVCNDKTVETFLTGAVYLADKDATVEPTCAAKGSITTYYKHNGKVFSFKEDIDKVNHTLNGVKIDVTKPVDIDLNAGVKLFADVKLSCAATPADGYNKTGNGFFTCEACEEPVAITVVKNHRGTWTYETDVTTGKLIYATCTSGANKTMAKCLDCNDTKIPGYDEALAHKDAATFDWSGAKIMNNEDKTLGGTYRVYCALCDQTIGGGNVSAIKELKNLKLKNAKTVVDATCKTNGTATFVVTIDEKEEIIPATIAMFDHLTQSELKSTSNIFVLERKDAKDEIEYYAVFECPTCGDFFVLEGPDFDSADKADVVKAIDDFKAELAEKEAEEAKKNENK